MASKRISTGWPPPPKPACWTSWRVGLTPLWPELPPWWLDGTLEAELQRTADDAAQSLPSPATWGKVREIVSPPSAALRVRAAAFPRSGTPSRSPPWPWRPTPRPSLLKRDVLVWQDPDDPRQSAELWLSLSPPPAATAPAPVRFRTQGQPSHQLDGMPVQLAGLTVAIRNSTAPFTAGELYPALKSLRAADLCVGGRVWPCLTLD